MIAEYDTLIQALLIALVVLAFVAQLRGWGIPKRTFRRAPAEQVAEAAEVGIERVQFVHDGAPREFYYYLPKSGGAGRPLILALHGGAGNALGFGKRTFLNRMADKFDYVMVLPQAISDGVQTSSWNAITPGRLGYAEANDVDDIGFLTAIIDRMKKIVDYDPERVFVLGLSKGGMMAYRLATIIPDRLRAIAVVAGTYPAASKGPGSEKVALLHIHGTADENVPWEGGSGRFSRQGANWPPAAPGIDLFTRTTARNAIGPAERLTRDTTCEIRRRKGRENVEICMVQGGGHAWPGSEPVDWQLQTNTYVSPYFDATDYIGGFFARC